MKFEDVIERDGKLVYTNVGDSMLPFIRQDRDLVVIEKPRGRLKKHDIASTSGTAENTCFTA